MSKEKNSPHNGNGTAATELASLELELPHPDTGEYQLARIKLALEENGRKEQKIPALVVEPAALALGASKYFLLGRTPKEKKDMAVFPINNGQGFVLGLLEKPQPPEAERPLRPKG